MASKNSTHEKSSLRTSEKESDDGEEGNYPNISVVGAGYLGVRIAAEIALCGSNVVIFDSVKPEESVWEHMISACIETFTQSMLVNDRMDTLWARVFFSEEEIRERTRDQTRRPGQVRRRKERKVPRTSTNSQIHKVCNYDEKSLDALRNVVKGTLKRRARVSNSMADAVSNADLVIEAIVEDVEVKRNFFCEVERHVKSTCVLSTNSLSISLEQISKALRRPQNLIGLRFLSPVGGIPFVEMWGPSLDQKCALHRTMKFMERLNKIAFKFDPESTATPESGCPRRPPRRLRLNRVEIVRHQYRAVSLFLRQSIRDGRRFDRDGGGGLDNMGSDFNIQWTADEFQSLLSTSTTTPSHPLDAAAADSIARGKSDGSGKCDDNDDDTSESDRRNKCVVCMVRPGTVLILSCGHRILCEACTASLRLFTPRCPLCREHIGSTVHLVEEHDLLGCGENGPESPAFVK